MILIADAGGSKTEWCLLDKNNIIDQFTGTGINALMLGKEELGRLIEAELGPHAAGHPISNVYFYGAGCISDKICSTVTDALRKVVGTESTIEVATDLLGTARALCGRHSGVACILGTGSNSCYYDGEKVVENVSPLGFILGDEGSGAVLGRTLVGDVLKNQLPKDLCEKFLTEFELDRLTIIKRVYKEAGANRFLASFVPFLKANIGRREIHDLVYRGFTSFFKRNVLQYPACRKVDINFTGSVAWHFSETLIEAAEDCGCHIGVIAKSPMEGLIQFHSNERL